LAEVKGGAEKLDGVVWVLRTWRQQLMAGLIAAFTAGIEDRSGQLGCRRKGSDDFSLVFLFSSSFFRSAPSLLFLHQIAASAVACRAGVARLSGGGGLAEVKSTGCGGGRWKRGDRRGADSWCCWVFGIQGSTGWFEMVIWQRRARRRRFG
jgi:hypothetical protein